LSQQARARIGLAMLASLASAGPAAAHPHVFIDYAVTVLFDDADVKGIRMAWTFDEMYSSMLFHDYTGRPHGALTPNDIKSLETGAFRDTADFHYFVDLKLNGKVLPVADVTDFDARFEKRRMTYFFTVPLRTAAPIALNTLEIQAFDHEFYIDFEPAKTAAVAVEHGESLAASCGLKHNRTDTTTFGPLDTLEVACTYKTTS
jgi:ABC-type uncharacterized transport system substrate-binding protein